MGLVLTAGHRRAPATLAVAELLRRQGVDLAGILVTASLNPRRLRSLIRQRGLRATMNLGRKLFGVSGTPGSKVLREAFQAWEIEEIPIAKWCHQHGVACQVVSSLNSERALQLIRDESVEGVVYTGGGILRRPFLDAVGGRVLNAHSGKLPEIRGMNACEWSILLDVPLHVTIHLIDSGIDTGQRIETIPVHASAEDTLDDLRQRCVATGIEGLVRHAPSLSQMQLKADTSQPSHRQCFVMAPVMRELAENKWLAVRSRNPSP